MVLFVIQFSPVCNFGKFITFGVVIVWRVCCCVISFNEESGPCRSKTFLLIYSRKEDILTPEVGHGRKVFALKFHPFDDNIFLTGGWDRCVKVQGHLPFQFSCRFCILQHLFMLYTFSLLTVSNSKLSNFPKLKAGEKAKNKQHFKVVVDGLCCLPTELLKLEDFVSPEV